MTTERTDQALDRICLRQMEFFGYHGVYEEENRLGQKYVVDLELHLDLAAAGRSDRLEHTVDYAAIVRDVGRIVETTRFRLIEALATRIAHDILHDYPMIREIVVQVTKPHPPLDAHFAGVSVQLHRKRERM